MVTGKEGAGHSADHLTRPSFPDLWPSGSIHTWPKRSHEKAISSLS